MNERIFNPSIDRKSPYSDGRMNYERSERRTPAELKRILESQEQHRVKKDIVDDSGQKICTVEIDERDGRLLSVICETYINTEASAEHPDEKIYITSDDGKITEERLTRKEAREQEKRYLIVTSLILHGEDVLIQKRSLEKKVDPDKLSTSAHGVAKELYYGDKKRIDDGQTAALINTGLEINEELRHGTSPFTIKIWPGTHDELFAYVAEEKIHDPDTIFLVPQAYLPDNNYPLNRAGEKRTRAISAGFIFSKQKPEISIDPHELQACEWKKVIEVFQQSEKSASADLPRSAMVVMEQILQDSPLAKRYGRAIVENLLRKYRYPGAEPRERP